MYDCWHKNGFLELIFSQVFFSSERKQKFRSHLMLKSSNAAQIRMNEFIHKMCRATLFYQIILLLPSLLDFSRNYFFINVSSLARASVCIHVEINWNMKQEFLLAFFQLYVLHDAGESRLYFCSLFLDASKRNVEMSREVLLLNKAANDERVH